MKAGVKVLEEGEDNLSPYDVRRRLWLTSQDFSSRRLREALGPIIKNASSTSLRKEGEHMMSTSPHTQVKCSMLQRIPIADARNPLIMEPETRPRMRIDGQIKTK